VTQKWEEKTPSKDRGESNTREGEIRQNRGGTILRTQEGKKENPAGKICENRKRLVHRVPPPKKSNNEGLPGGVKCKGMRRSLGANSGNLVWGFEKSAGQKKRETDHSPGNQPPNQKKKLDSQRGLVLTSWGKSPGGRVSWGGFKKLQGEQRKTATPESRDRKGVRGAKTWSQSRLNER